MFLHYVQSKWVAFLEWLHKISFLCQFFQLFFLLMQAANIEAEGSGIPYSEYQLIKQEVSGLGRGKYSGTHDSYNLFTCLSAACLAVLC